jgi:hypothetical protein
MLHALTLLFRAGGAVLIGVATFGYSAASGRDLIIEAAAFAIGAVVVAYWLMADLRPRYRQPRVLAGALIVMAAASGCEDAVQMTISNPLPPGGPDSPGSPGPGAAFSTVNGGYGLTGMRERLLLINGTLTAAAADGHWTVTAQVPR